MQQNSQPLELEEAVSALIKRFEPTTATETIALNDAVGRVLARDVDAPIDLPPFPNSAMDGYAILRADWDRGLRIFRVIGSSLAGHPETSPLASGQSVRVFTGAALPGGADQVLLQEEVAERTEDTVTFAEHAPSEAYVRGIGHDIRRGALQAQAGQRLTPLLSGSLTASGITEVEVRKRLRVGVFSSGDELVAPGVPLGPGQIYDSNRFTVLRLLDDPCFAPIDLGRLEDDPARVRERLQEAAEGADVLITSGGVSVGSADHIRAAIEALGELVFWRLNLKPGKPMAVATLNDTLVFGLPGNPVSTIVTLLLVAMPVLKHLAGARDFAPVQAHATLTERLDHAPGRTEFQRGIMSWTAAGLEVRGTGDQSSNRLSTFRDANCLIRVPGTRGALEAGERVEVLPLSGLGV